MESFIQLCLQTGGEATLIHIRATVQHHFSWLRGVSVISHSKQSSVDSYESLLVTSFARFFFPFCFLMSERVKLILLTCLAIDRAIQSRYKSYIMPLSTCPGPQGQWQFQHYSSGFSLDSGSSAPGLMGHTFHSKWKLWDPGYEDCLSSPQIAAQTLKRERSLTIPLYPDNTQTDLYRVRAQPLRLTKKCRTFICVSEHVWHRRRAIKELVCLPVISRLDNWPVLQKKEEFYFETTNSPSLSHSKGDRWWPGDNHQKPPSWF